MIWKMNMFIEMNIEFYFSYLLEAIFYTYLPMEESC